MTSPEELADIDDRLPPVLAALLAKTRKGLKLHSRVSVEVGAEEVRAVYAMSTAMQKAREARDTQKAKTRKAQLQLAEAQASVADFDLLNRKGVLSLLVDIERLLDGSETSQQAAYYALERVKKYLARSRRGGKR